MLLPGLALEAVGCDPKGVRLRRKLLWSWRCYIGDQAQRTESGPCEHRGQTSGLWPGMPRPKAQGIDIRFPPDAQLACAHLFTCSVMIC